MALRHEEALWQELLGARPEPGVVVDGVVVAPYQAVFCWETEAGVLVLEEEIPLAISDGCSGWEEAKGFLHHGIGVRQAVQEFGLS
jgi:hypothetical protein